jgi:hypothetical protein
LFNFDFESKHLLIGFKIDPDRCFHDTNPVVVILVYFSP